MAIKMLAVDSDPEFFSELMAEFADELSILKGNPDLSELERILNEESPSVLILGPSLRDDILKDFLSFAREVRASCVVLRAKLSSQKRQKLLEMGAVEAFEIPVGRDYLLESIRFAAKFSGVKKGERNLAKVITIFSTKGGVGKTVVATNLAVALAQREQAKVVLIDLDLQFGDVGIMLHLKPKQTIENLVGEIDSLSVTEVENFLTPYDPWVKVLAAPLQPEAADLISPEVIKPVLHYLKEIADYIVVDTPASFNDNVLTVLDESDEVYLVGTMDLPSIKNVKLCFQTMKLLKYSDEKIKLVLNKVERGIGLSLAEIEESLQTNVWLKVPADRTVPLSINKGVPVVVDAPRSPVAISIYRLSELAGKQYVSVKTA